MGGKSNKKGKSDRINALRKQYDMFLEEDKKRKERNDFILGRLDKMRYNNALVPVRHKASAYEPRPAVVDRIGFQPEFSSGRGFQSCITNQSQLFPDIQIKNNEDAYLIQEISKKYILIPKLRTTFMHNYINNETINQHPERLHEISPDQDAAPIKDLKPNSHDNTDWKSKYEILNILKNEEKGKPMTNYQADLVDMKQSVPKEISLNNDQDKIPIDLDNFINRNLLAEIPKEFFDEIPVKDLTVEPLNHDLPKDSENSANNKVCADVNFVAKATENATSNENNIDFANVEQTKDIGDHLQNITLEYKHPDSFNNGISQEVAHLNEPQHEPEVNMAPVIAEVDLKYNVNEENLNVHGEYPVEADSAMHSENISAEQYDPAESEQVVYVDNTEVSPMQDLNYNMQPTPDHSVNNGIYEEENAAQFSNDQEYAPNIGVQMRTDTTAIPEDQTYLNSNPDIVEQVTAGYEQTENPEMYYTEQTDENYIQQQGDEANPLQFSQNEYPQNQEYAYYENIEPEAYPVDLNEHEVTEAYDPHYEQQYVELDQGAEQQQYDEQQYQEPETDTNQVDPEFKVLQYEQSIESRDQIEKTLNSEDGYTPQVPPGEETAITLDDKSLPAA